MDPLDATAWKERFFKDKFSVDQCLQEYTQKSDLETLRKDLRNYGVELQLDMSDILKNETEAIANLAEYLTNLNSKIDNLSVPISQLGEEVRTLYDLINMAKNNYQQMLDSVKNNNCKQNHIHLKLGIINSSVYINTVINIIESDITENLLTLERIVNKYSFQKIYLDELNLMTSDIENIVKNIESKLVTKINKCFLTAYKNGDSDILLRSLRMYANLQKQDDAHYIVQKEIVKPELKPLFTEKYFKMCGSDLSKVYLEVKSILDTKVEILTRIVKENPYLSSFNFVLISFWREFDLQSREGLPHVTAPGNPELFQKRYTSAYNLLKYIAEKAGDKNLVKGDESFQSYLKRFNLPVYFEIKFQQIATNFEADTINLKLENILAEENEHSFRLKPSVALWKQIISCFHQDVYIDQLADHFIRLVMMLLSRYIKLIEAHLKEIVASDIDRDKVDGFVINVLIDLCILQTLLAPNLQNRNEVDRTIFAIINSSIWNVLQKLFKANEKAILNIQNVFKSHIIISKITDCASQLQNVTAIPRLYRRTNRHPPKEASAYMVEAIKPILIFEKRFKSMLKEQLSEIVNSIIDQITKQYLSLVQDVLMSVRKTEESLRRLKSRTLNISGDDFAHAPSETMSDETKIREQIKYDVGYFCDKLYSLANHSVRDSMESLKKEVCL